MLEISNVALSLDEGSNNNEAALTAAAARALGVQATEIVQVKLIKRSVDARKKSNVHFVATLAVELKDRAIEVQVLATGAKIKGANVKDHTPIEPLDIPDLSNNPLIADALENTRPVVVGFGPAGMFSALYLAEAGLRPIVIERGGSVDERLAAVQLFNEGGPLDLSTNIQFGEGGAGTFSDGKLTTGIKSPLLQHVLRWFVEAGAPEEILWEAKPHIGTDKLVQVVRAIRERIESLGGEVNFHTQLTGISMKSGKLSSVESTSTKASYVAKPEGWQEPPVQMLGLNTTRIPVRVLVLACGHSARDTFELLKDCNLLMEPKPFSMGVRIEHLQSDINQAQYGQAAEHPALSAADYKLVTPTPNGRSAYTFCMCPGGTVTCATSEEDAVVVNGMSLFARDGENSNAALLVGVDPADFASDDPLAGVALQRSVEHAAFELAACNATLPYQAPAQTVGDFLAHTSGTPSTKVTPSYARGVIWCDLHECLPDFVADTIEEALLLLGRKLKGFDDPQAVMTGVETRSSSPVRIVRSDDFCAQFALNNFAFADDECDTNEAIPARGIYPVGEGAGYAGGIMSAAVDGLRVAMSIVEKLQIPAVQEDEEFEEQEFDWMNWPVD